MPLKIHEDPEPAINLTPMVDVVFQLILFFLLGTKFTEMERKIELEIPRVTSNPALAATAQGHTIAVYRDGTLSFDGTPVSLDQLVERLQGASPGGGAASVLVRADAQGPFQAVATALSACKQAGVRQLAIAVMPIEKTQDSRPKGDQ